MPRALPRCNPLRRTELDTILSTLFHDPSASVEAFTATAMALYQFCPADDVDAALLAIPRATVH